MGTLRTIAAACGAVVLIACGQDLVEGIESEGVSAALSATEQANISAWAAARNAPDDDIVDRVVTASNSFDCVPWERQPSIKGSGIKRRDIVAPTQEPAELTAQVTQAQPAQGVASQAVETEYSRSSHKCPEGTVPLRRYTQRELAKFKTLTEVQDYYERPSHIIQCNLSNPQRYYETYVAELSPAKDGAHTELLVNTSVSVATGHTIGQMWLAVNHHTCEPMTSSVETLESGWVRRPGGSVELFVFYTPDGYNTYCYNSSCPGMTGFTWLSGNVPGSAFTGNGYLQMAWHLYLPGNSFGVTPGWWFYANGWVGYYPRSIYDAGLQNGVTLISAGGEIMPNHGNQMGNGLWGNDANASYVDKFWYLDWDHNYYYMPNAYYYGDGRYDTTSGGKYYVDGRQIFGWPVTGTYSSVINSTKSFFRYGGPGP